jgi:hypothetical protein
VSDKPDDLDLLFNGHYLVNVQYFRFKGPSTPERSFTGYAPYGDMAAAAPPVVAFQFMLDHDILQSNHKAVLGQMLEFTRADMIHAADAHSALDMMDTLYHQAVRRTDGAEVERRRAWNRGISHGRSRASRWRRRV